MLPITKRLPPTSAQLSKLHETQVCNYAQEDRRTEDDAAALHPRNEVQGAWRCRILTWDMHISAPKPS